MKCLVCFDNCSYPVEIICPICFDNCPNPVKTKCNHNFCNKCLIKLQKLSSECPLCKNELDYKFLIKIYILNDPITCKNRHIITFNSYPTVTQAKTKVSEYLISRNLDTNLKFGWMDKLSHNIDSFNDISFHLHDNQFECDVTVFSSIIQDNITFQNAITNFNHQNFENLLCSKFGYESLCYNENKALLLFADIKKEQIIDQYVVKAYIIKNLYDDTILVQLETPIPCLRKKCYKKQDKSKDFFIDSDVISSFAFKKYFTESEFLIFIFGSLTTSCLQNFFAFCFNMPFIKTSNG